MKKINNQCESRNSSFNKPGSPSRTTDAGHGCWFLLSPTITDSFRKRSPYKQKFNQFSKNNRPEFREHIECGHVNKHSDAAGLFPSDARGRVENVSGFEMFFPVLSKSRKKIAALSNLQSPRGGEVDGAVRGSSRCLSSVQARLQTSGASSSNPAGPGRCLGQSDIQSPQTPERETPIFPDPKRFATRFLTCRLSCSPENFR